MTKRCNSDEFFFNFFSLLFRLIHLAIPNLLTNYPAFWLLALVPSFAYQGCQQTGQFEDSVAYAPVPPGKLQEEMAEWLQEPGMRSASVSLFIADAKTGAELFALQPDLSLSPASTLKIMTTAAALEVLGPDFRFQTTLSSFGTMEGELLNGHLVIQGSGDPSLAANGTDSLFTAWGKQVASAGIKEISGGVVADASCFSKAVELPGTWPWEDLGNYYGAGAYGINFLENQYEVFFKTGKKAGDPTDILGTNPPIAELRIENRVLTGTEGSGDQSFIYGAPFTFSRVARGTLPPGRAKFVVKGSIPDPALLLAHSFQEFLKKQGVRVLGGPQAMYEKNMVSLTGLSNLLARHESPALPDLIRTVNHRSFNLYAEALLKVTGLRYDGQEGRVGAVIGILEKSGVAVPVSKGQQTASSQPEGFWMEDGSGLSRFNSVTTRQLVGVLRYMQQKSPHAAVFKASLPIAGEGGTVRNLSKGRTAQGRMWLKSGSMRRVRAYAGYATTVAGQEVVFAFIVNNSDWESTPMRRRMEDIFDLMVTMKP